MVARFSETKLLVTVPKQLENDRALLACNMIVLGIILSLPVGLAASPYQTRGLTANAGVRAG